MIQGSTATAGSCWFCSKGRGGGESVAYPFDAQDGGEIRVVVVPRCGACAQAHRTQMLPSAAILIAAAIVPPTLVTLLAPVSGGWRTALNAMGMIAGLAVGIVLVSQRERRTAARAGTRPAYDSREHEAYKALAGDTARWRPRSIGNLDPASTSTSARAETVFDYRQHFRNDPRALAALDAGSQAAGIVLPA